MKALIRYAGMFAVAAMLAGILAFLYLKTEALDPTRRIAVTGALRDLKQVDAEWNVELLRSKTWLTKNYDAVTAPQSVTAKLERAIAAQAALDTRVSEAQAQLQKTLETKIDLVDQFKAQNAITRNSVRFIPTATADLKQAAHAAGEANPAKRAQMAALSDAAEQILVETLKLDSSSDTGAVPDIRRKLSDLVVQREQYPQSVLVPFDIYTNHVITILAQKEREEDVLGKLDGLPLVQRIDALSTSIDAVYGKADQQRETYRIAMFSYSGLLVLMLAYLAFRRRSA